MSWREIIYQYDGSFEGILCCIFESYTQKELPTAIVCDEELEPCLFEIRRITTDREHAGRIYRSLRKISPDVCPFLRRVYLTALAEKELLMYRFVAKLYREGAPLLRRFTDNDYEPLLKAVRHMNGEAHLLKGFIRFSEFDGVLASEITPKNRVLPLLRSHFCDRYRNEAFFIYDKTHAEALLYSRGVSRIVPLEAFSMAPPSAEEATYRLLWRRFYETIAIRERENPRLRMSNMPKRFWDNMTEFQTDGSLIPPPEGSPADAALPAAPAAKPAPVTPSIRGPFLPV